VADLAALSALAAACAPQVAPATLMAITQVESGLDPLAIGVNGPHRAALRPRSAAEAAAAARRLIAEGRDVDLGLGQINQRNLGSLGLSLEAAFDPCRNLAASAAVLQAGYRRARLAGAAGPAALRTALSFYNTGHPTRGLRNGYVAKVVAAAARVAPAPVEPAVRPEPPAAPPAWDVFARARARAVFVLTPPAEQPS